MRDPSGLSAHPRRAFINVKKKMKNDATLTGTSKQRYE